MPDRDLDPSASTAQFRAFADGRSGDSAPWQMRAPRNRVAVLAAVVIGVAVVLFLIALLVIG
jgi:multisubunit Na+/H+ antiporter MnhC subunit